MSTELSIIDRLHGKPFAVAEKLAEAYVADHPDSEEECLEALESHPQNPDNAKTEEPAPAPAPNGYTTKEAVLTALAKQEITVEQATGYLAALEPAPTNSPVYCKVSVKGAVSLYGINRMPVTLYAEQWERVFGFRAAEYAKASGLGPMILKFILDNEGKTFDVVEKDKGGKAVRTLKVTLSRGKKAK